MDFSRWDECRTLERPGIVFELEDAEGRSMQSPCMLPLQTPFDWPAPPVRFRPIAQEPAVRSAPLPPPSGPGSGD